MHNIWRILTLRWHWASLGPNFVKQQWIPLLKPLMTTLLNLQCFLFICLNMHFFQLSSLMKPSFHSNQMMLTVNVYHNWGPNMDKTWARKKNLHKGKMCLCPQNHRESTGWCCACEEHDSTWSKGSEHITNFPPNPAADTWQRQRCGEKTSSALLVVMGRGLPMTVHDKGTKRWDAHTPHGRWNGHQRHPVLRGRNQLRSVTQCQSNSLWPHGLYRPWNSPGQKTGVGSHSLLQGIFPTQGSNTGLLHCRQILYQLSQQGSPKLEVQFSSVTQSCPTLCDPIDHSTPLCPSPTPGLYQNSCLLSRWCHPNISSSVIPFSTCLQSFSASGSFPMSQFFTSVGHCIGASVSASVLPMNVQDWFPLGLISM